MEDFERIRKVWWQHLQRRIPPGTPTLDELLQTPHLSHVAVNFGNRVNLKYADGKTLAEKVRAFEANEDR